MHAAKAENVPPMTRRPRVTLMIQPAKSARTTVSTCPRTIVRPIIGVANRNGISRFDHHAAPNRRGGIESAASSVDTKK